MRNRCPNALFIEERSPLPLRESSHAAKGAWRPCMSEDTTPSNFNLTELAETASRENLFAGEPRGVVRTPERRR